MEVFVSSSALRLSNALCFPADSRVADLVRHVLIDHGFPSEDFYVTSNGRLVSAAGEPLLQDAAYRLEPRLCGGKGGFGSMLRALGAQIEKTTNREACRDLSGRRLRDVNHEKEMAEWLKKQAELDGQKDQRRLERLQSKLQPPRHQFSDTEYQQQCHELSERLEDSVLKGMQASSAGAVSAEAGPSTKRTNQHPDPVPRKKKRFWAGAGDLDLLDSEDEDDEDEGPGPSHQTRPSGDPVSTGPDKPGPGPVSTGTQQPGPGTVRPGTKPPGPVSTSTEQPGPGPGTEQPGRGPGTDQPGPGPGTDRPGPEPGTDQPGPVSISTEQPGPHGSFSTSPEQSGPCSDQPGPVSTGSDQPGPVSTGPDQPGPEPPVPGPVSPGPGAQQPLATPPHAPVDLESAGSPEDLEVLGLGRLKEELQARGLKCGGTLKERAARLYAVRGLGPEQLEAQLVAKPRKRK